MAGIQRSVTKVDLSMCMSSLSSQIIQFLYYAQIFKCVPTIAQSYAYIAPPQRPPSPGCYFPRMNLKENRPPGAGIPERSLKIFASACSDVYLEISTVSVSPATHVWQGVLLTFYRGLRLLSPDEFVSSWGFWPRISPPTPNTSPMGVRL